MQSWSKLLLDKFGLERRVPEREAIDTYAEERLREYERAFGVPGLALREALQHFRVRKEAFKQNHVNCEQLFIAGFVIGHVEGRLSRAAGLPSEADLDRMAEEEAARAATAMRQPGEEG